MYVREAIPILLFSLAGVSDARGFLLGPHRRFYPDFVSRCPPAYQGLPVDELSRRSLQELKDMIGSQTDVPSGLSELPCGGVPTDEANVQKVRPGTDCPVKWTLEQSVGSQCKVTLMCPGKRDNQVLWTGSCGSQPGETEVKVKLPRDLSKCGAGECFLQWKMDTPEKHTYCGCVDIFVEGDAAADKGGDASGRQGYTTGGSSLTPPTGSGDQPEQPTGPGEQPEQPTGSGDQPLDVGARPAETITATETCTVTCTMTNTQTLPAQTMTETLTMTETSIMTETSTITETVTQPMTIVSAQMMPTTITETVTETQTLSNVDKGPATEISTPTLGYGQTIGGARELPASSAQIEYESTTTACSTVAAAYQAHSALVTPHY